MSRCASASCTRREAGGGGFCSGCPGSGTAVDQLVPILHRAEKYLERLRKDRRVLVALDEHAFQRGEHVRTVVEADDLQRLQRVDGRAGPDRHAGGAQRPRKADDVVGDDAGRHRQIQIIGRIWRHDHECIRCGKPYSMSFAPQQTLDFID